MEISPLAGKPAPKNMLVDLSRLEREYYERRPDIGDPDQLVSFGTSGHRGSSLRATFTESHILAITQAICDCRRSRGIDGPPHMGKDTHGLSSPAQRTVLEVLAANEVETFIQRDNGVNAYWEPLRFELTPIPEDESRPWRRWLDTLLEAPDDICVFSNAPLVGGSSYLVNPRSIVALARIAEAHPATSRTEIDS